MVIVSNWCMDYCTLSAVNRNSWCRHANVRLSVPMHRSTPHLVTLCALVKGEDNTGEWSLYYLAISSIKYVIIVSLLIMKGELVRCTYLPIVSLLSLVMWLWEGGQQPLLARVSGITQNNTRCPNLVRFPHTRRLQDPAVVCGPWPANHVSDEVVGVHHQLHVEWMVSE